MLSLQEELTMDAFLLHLVLVVLRATFRMDRIKFDILLEHWWLATNMGFLVRMQLPSLGK